MSEEFQEMPTILAATRTLPNITGDLYLSFKLLSQKDIPKYTFEKSVKDFSEPFVWITPINSFLVQRI